MNYGFKCICPLCSFSSSLNVSSPLVQDGSFLQNAEAKLRQFALGSDDRVVRVRADIHTFTSMPETVHPLLHESYLPSISEEFSRTSHEGLYEDAVSKGLTLLALYVVLYPANYPQIGTISMAACSFVCMI